MPRKRKSTPQSEQPLVPNEPGRTPVNPDDPKPNQQAAQPLVPNEPDRTPANPDDLIQKFVTAHVAFERTFGEALQHARDAGEALLRLQMKTGLKGVALFASIRKEAEILGIALPPVSDRSCYLYQRIASRFNELRIVGGDNLNEMTLTKAIKLLQQSKEEKPTPPAKDEDTPPSGQPEMEIASESAPSVSTNAVVEAETEVKSEATKDKPKPPEGQPEPEIAIEVQPPFDQPVKDRLAAVYAQNGPAPTPIQRVRSVHTENLQGTGNTNKEISLISPAG
jgi:hypothetical protein